MRVVTSDSGSVSVGNQYTDELENPDTSDDAEFWRKEASVPRFAAAPSSGRWRLRVYVAVGVTALMLLLLIITLSVSHVKFDRKFSTTDTKIKNLTETLLSIITRTNFLEESGHKMHLDINNLEFDQETMQTRMNDMSDSEQALRDKVSELKCRIEKYIKNNTQELCCPEGWLLFSTHCYFFSKDGMPWDAARDECEKKRAALLILNSKQEKNWVVSNTRPLFYWLGLTDGRTGEWEWLDETPYVFVRSEWMPGQPDNWEYHGLGGGEDCAHFHHDGRYNDDHCSRHYRYVCKAHASSINWVVSNTRPLFYWLGLTDGRTGEWEWLDETPYVFVRSEWMPGQPDNWEYHGLGGGEDCAHFHHDGRYNDDHCSRHYRYVCKARASSI